MQRRYDEKLTELETSIASLLDTIYNANKISLEAYQTCDWKLFDDAVNLVQNVQEETNRIDNLIIKTFAMFGPEANQLRELVAYLKMTNEIARISEAIRKYARRMREHCESEFDLSALNSTIIQLHKSTINSLELISKCFHDKEHCDVEKTYRNVMVEESKNDDLFGILEKEILSQVLDHTDDTTDYVRILRTLHKLERTCDRSVNIANLMLFAQRGGKIEVN